MNGFPWFMMLIGIVAFLIASWLEIQGLRDQRSRGVDPHEISTVCMECRCHIRGPRPSRARLISHGLCPQCAAKWEAEMLGRPTSTTLNNRPNHTAVSNLKSPIINQ